MRIKTYTVNNTQSLEGASSIQDLEKGIDNINDSVGMSNNWLSNIAGILANIWGVITNLPQIISNAVTSGFGYLQDLLTNIWGWYPGFAWCNCYWYNFCIWLSIPYLGWYPGFAWCITGLTSFLVFSGSFRKYLGWYPGFAWSIVTGINFVLVLG